MVTMAQIIASRRTKLVPSNVEGNYEITNSFMQNKPNFRKTKMNITSAITKDYKNKYNWTFGQNKPNQTQFQYQICKTNPIEPNFNTKYAKQTQIEPNFSPKTRMLLRGAGKMSKGPIGVFVWQLIYSVNSYRGKIPAYYDK